MQKLTLSITDLKLREKYLTMRSRDIVKLSLLILGMRILILAVRLYTALTKHHLYGSPDWFLVGGSLVF